MAKKRKGSGAASLSLICLLISGIGVGWLLGLSVSPVLHIIVASVMALVMGIVGALAGLDTNPGKENDGQSNEIRISKPVKISPFPMTALIAGLVVGACFGIYARTNELLGANPQRLVQKWNGVSGLDDNSIKRRLFDQLYPPTSSNETSNGQFLTTEKQQNQVDEPPTTANGIPSKKAPPLRKTPTDNPANSQLSITSHSGTLFTVLSVQECGLIRFQRGEALRTKLKAFGKRQINSFLDKCESDDCIEALKEMLCAKKD